MRNRAKCKLCESIIESINPSDCVSCLCGEIYVKGGELMFCAANNWENFLRIDSEGNVIVPKIEEGSNVKPLDIVEKPSKKEILAALINLVETIENMPSYAMTTAITHYDWLSLLLLIRSFFEADCADES